MWSMKKRWLGDWIEYRTCRRARFLFGGFLQQDFNSVALVDAIDMMLHFAQVGWKDGGGKMITFFRLCFDMLLMLRYGLLK